MGQQVVTFSLAGNRGKLDSIQRQQVEPLPRLLEAVELLANDQQFLTQTLRALRDLFLQVRPLVEPKRPKRPLTDWNLKEIALLGEMTDASAAAALDLAHSAVRLKRISLGIPPFGRKGS